MIAQKSDLLILKAAKLTRVKSVRSVSFVERMVELKQIFLELNQLSPGLRLYSLCLANSDWVSVDNGCCQQSFFVSYRWSVVTLQYLFQVSILEAFLLLLKSAYSCSGVFVYPQESFESITPSSACSIDVAAPKIVDYPRSDIVI